MNIFLFYVKTNKIFVLILIFLLFIALIACLNFNTISYKETKSDGSSRELILSK